MIVCLMVISMFLRSGKCEKQDNLMNGIPLNAYEMLNFFSWLFQKSVRISLDQIENAIYII